MVSIVIPVHNEAGRLAEVLAPVQKVIRDKNWQAVIICNGCTDDSAAIARSFNAFTVLESEIPSKVCALNLGDQHAKFGARIYMDSDLTITFTGPNGSWRAFGCRKVSFGLSSHAGGCF